MGKDFIKGMATGMAILLIIVLVIYISVMQIFNSRRIDALTAQTNQITTWINGVVDNGRRAAPQQRLAPPTQPTPQVQQPAPQQQENAKGK